MAMKIEKMLIQATTIENFLLDGWITLRTAHSLTH